MSESIDISPSQHKELLALIQYHLPNVEVWVFGSRVKWTARSHSDLDLVAFTKPEDQAYVSHLKEAIEESSLPFRVDLLVWDKIPENFQKNIQEHYVVLVKGKNAGQGGDVNWDISSDWQELTLGEFVRLQRGYDLSASDQKSGMVPVISSAGSNGTHSKSMASGPGVVIEQSGAAMGRVHYCEVDYWPHNTCWYVTDFLGNDPLFAYYKLAELDLKRFNSGSAQHSLNRNHIYKMRLSVPKPNIQKRIAQIIRAFNDKINLNLRIHQALEAMAQTIFQSWFVDFDPVKAKVTAEQEDNDPMRTAMSAISGKPDAELDTLPPEAFAQLAATAALFPDEIEDSVLGKIPRGWIAKPLDSITDYLNGLALQNGSPKSASDIKPEYVVCDGDVLFSWSDSLEVDVWTGERSTFNQHICTVTSSQVPKWFYFLAIRHHLPQLRKIAVNKTTTLSHIRKHLSDTQIATPSPELLNQATKVISPLLDETISLRLQSRQLAKVRDTLLPKLLSGKLSVTVTMT